MLRLGAIYDQTLLLTQVGCWLDLRGGTHRRCKRERCGRFRQRLSLTLWRGKSAMVNHGLVTPSRVPLTLGISMEKAALLEAHWCEDTRRWEIAQSVCYGEHKSRLLPSGRMRSTVLTTATKKTSKKSTLKLLWRD